MSGPTITSASNPRIRDAARLRDRRARSRTGLTLVDGTREVDRALKGGAQIVEAFVDPERLAGTADDLLDRLERARVPTTHTAPEVLDRLEFGDRSEGVVAVVQVPPTTLAGLVLPPDPLVVVVEGVEKPGNLGAILRSADGAGASALVAADPVTDLYNPNTIRASLGTIFALAVAAATARETLTWLRERDIHPFAARVEASLPYSDADLRGPIAVVLGSESHGLTDVWHDEGVVAIRLPMHGVADSLNVAATAAVLLYEARRQRDAP